MLPFVRDRLETVSDNAEDEASGSPHFDMVDAIAEDFMHALHTKDKLLMRGALEALIDHIQNLDEVEDLQQNMRERS